MSQTYTEDVLVKALGKEDADLWASDIYQITREILLDFPYQVFGYDLYHFITPFFGPSWSWSRCTVWSFSEYISLETFLLWSRTYPSIAAKQRLILKEVIETEWSPR